MRQSISQMKVNQISPVVVAQDPHLFASLNFDRQMGSGAHDQAKVLQFAAIRDYCLGHVAVYPG